MKKPPYTVDPAVVKRFDGRMSVFARVRTDPSASFYGKHIDSGVEEIMARGEPSRSRPDCAEAAASWAVDDYFRAAYGEEKLTKSNRPNPEFPRHEFGSPREAAERLKTAARRFGASSAGVARVNPLWIYSHKGRGKEIKLPEGVEHALVMAVPMDRELIKTSPAFTASTATGWGYSMMAAAAAGLAETIRRLGWRAISSGNDTALSIPLAVDAGLGVMGRSGMLLTRERGPFVRICKVFTDLPLAPDEPEAEPADDFCAKCGACARACPAGAISPAKKPSYETLSASNRPGVLRWPVDAEKCYSFWIENGSDCSSCIAACPYPGKKS